MATRAEVVSSLRFAESQHPGRLALEMLDAFRYWQKVKKLTNSRTERRISKCSLHSVSGGSGCDMTRSQLSRPSSGKNVMQNMCGEDSREAHIESLRTKCESFVIQAQQVQQSCVDVANMRWMLHGTETEFIRFAINLAGFEATAREPHGE